jgi:hypothetical protein
MAMTKMKLKCAYYTLLLIMLELTHSSEAEEQITWPETPPPASSPQPSESGSTYQPSDVPLPTPSTPKAQRGRGGHSKVFVSLPTPRTPARKPSISPSKYVSSIEIWSSFLL